eukprot:CAMPEP_0197521730 /NCGR_PEP_ID=MMETSP1318-20131121/6969_1 /TAXON_ID=552666 /ORGANISM="Partenskyella glossopodia, Strain RCC365" /LENGTH=127 /DNA_ID=CAMNT_0043073837 /DNA_START=267 /DNA_END=650 /DNA_ORIENTATION=+
MHGNTRKTADGSKTRDFESILGEIKHSHALLKEYGQHLGGIHLELTGEDVTECVGGAAGVGDQDLARNWKSACDPRLNYLQSLHLAVEVAKMLAEDVGHVDVDVSDVDVDAEELHVEHTKTNVRLAY